MFKSKNQSASQEEQKAAKKKIIIRAMTVLVILGATSSFAVSTYAYAAAAALVQLSNIGVSTLEPADIKLGLMNSATGNIDYYDQLTNSSFASSGQSLPTNAELYPVSSAFTSTWLTKGADDTYNSVTPMFVKSYQNAYDFNNPGFAPVSYYMQKEIFIKEEDTVSFPVKIYLSSNTTLTADTSSYSATGSSSQTASSLNNIVYAMRISILTPDAYYIVDPYKNGDTVLAGRLNIDQTDKYYDTYSYNYENGNYTNKEVLFGEYSPSTAIDDGLIAWKPASDTDSSLADASTAASAFNAYTKAGNQALDIETTKTNGVTLKTEDSLTIPELAYSENKASADNLPLVSLEPGTSKRIVVSYYVEGWDKDSANSFQYTSFLSNLVLTGKYDYSQSYQSN